MANIDFSICEQRLGLKIRNTGMAGTKCAGLREGQYRKARARFSRVRLGRGWPDPECRMAEGGSPKKRFNFLFILIIPPSY